MGTSINAQENAESEYVKAVHNVCRIVVERGFSVPQRSDYLYRFTDNYKCEQKSLKILHTYTNSIIRTKKKELAAQQTEINDNIDDAGIKKKVAFLDLLLQHQKKNQSLTDSEIREEVDTFMFTVTLHHKQILFQI